MIYTTFGIRGMKDISRTIPAGIPVWNDIHDAVTDASANTLVVAIESVTMDNEDGEQLFLERDVPSYEAHMVSVIDSRGNTVEIDRNIFEFMRDEMALYHGTTPASAKALSHEGWEPGSGERGCQYGKTSLLYVSNTPEQALWYSEQKSSREIVVISFRPKDVIVDPDDGCGEHFLEEYLASLSYKTPGNFAIPSQIPASKIKHMHPEKTMTLMP